MRPKYGAYPMSNRPYRQEPEWQAWQIDMLIESHRASVPLWAIAEEFGFLMRDVVNKLEWLRWRGVA
ncbi:MAG: hypothetical protein ACRDBM_00335 [Sporomusa sp.]